MPSISVARHAGAGDFTSVILSPNGIVKNALVSSLSDL